MARKQDTGDRSRDRRGTLNTGQFSPGPGADAGSAPPPEPLGADAMRRIVGPDYDPYEHGGWDADDPAPCGRCGQMTAVPMSEAIRFTNGAVCERCRGCDPDAGSPSQPDGINAQIAGRSCSYELAAEHGELVAHTAHEASHNPMCEPCLTVGGRVAAAAVWHPPDGSEPADICAGCIPMIPEWLRNDA